MKTRNLWMLLGAVLSFGFFSCEDNTGDTSAVAITNVVVTPEGSARSYNCNVIQQAAFIENTNDSIEWDIADAALANANVKVTATLNSTVFYNDQAIGADGIEINVTEPVQLIVKDNNGNAKTYILNVVRATTATGDAMILKSSTFNGFPANIISYDMAYFKNKFYAITASVTQEGDKKVEDYQLFSSEDGLNWTEVAYQTDKTGINFAEGQIQDYVIGGEGAQLAVFNDRLYVLGGARTQGEDKFGNEAEAETGWFSGPAIKEWRSFSTSDGITFSCDTVNMTFSLNDSTTVDKSALASLYMNAVVFNNKLYMKSGYTYLYGSPQGKQLCIYTEDGKNWEKTENAASNSVGDAFFEFKGKLWSIGGYKSFISSSNIRKEAYYSEDGINWIMFSDSINNVLGNLYNMKVVANDNVAYMFGGERLVEKNEGDGTSYVREISKDIFRSYDGFTWEKVEVPANYTGRRFPSVVLNGNTAWMFGGTSSVSTGNYGGFLTTEILATDTWTVLMK